MPMCVSLVHTPSRALGFLLALLFFPGVSPTTRTTVNERGQVCLVKSEQAWGPGWLISISVTVNSY